MAQLETETAELLDGAGEQAKEKDAADLDELEPEHEDPDPHDIEPKDLDVGEGRQEIVTAEQQHDGGEDALARLIEGEADELQCRGIRQGKARAGEAIDLGGDDAGHRQG